MADASATPFKITRSGKHVIIEFDIPDSPPLSSTGKTYLLATSLGTIECPEIYPAANLNINIYVKKEAFLANKAKGSPA